MRRRDLLSRVFRLTAALLFLASFWTLTLGGAEDSRDEPQFGDGNKLTLPQDYREWIYLSTGLGMNYNKASNDLGLFTNVFVAPSAYRQFTKTGQWPDKTVFVLEERKPSGVGSIVQSGHFQSDLVGFGAAVKDEKRFAEKWAYFSFSPTAKTATPNPKAACWQCHNEHGAVDNTFIQFYPTLKSVAEKFGTFVKERAEKTLEPK